MKNILMLLSLAFAGSALADSICQVDLVDTYRYSPRRGTVMTSFRSSDGNSGCGVAQRQCRDEIRRRNLEGRAECVRIRIEAPRPQPRPEPRPFPPYEPIPYPYPVNDAQRPLAVGESVIVNNKFQTVINSRYDGTFSVRTTDSWATVTNFVRREDISVTSGCNLGLCVNERVINTISGKYLTLVGLSYDNTYVTMSNDSWNTITSWNRRDNLAETKGCVSSRWVNLCVGDIVLNTFRREATVIGIQQDGRVVIETRDSWRTVTTNVDPQSLVVIR